MAHDAVRLSFKIDAFEPDSIPMARLAEYMGDLAAMLGEKADVHFVRLEDGCVQLLHDVSFTAYPKVQERTTAIRGGVAPVEAMNAYKALNRKLAADNTFASYRELDALAGLVLDFPGVKAPKPLEITPVEQPGALVGVVQGIGGRVISEKGVSVFIDTGDTVHTCTASRATAKELGPFILGEERRFEGTAQWRRDEDGAWTLRSFVIRTHEPLEGGALSDIVERLRAVPSGLSELRDPWGSVMADRRDEGEPH
ncbi:hypothetical protein [Phenylobacterium sp.]|uniref:hypothetical protein n=1 Tax=Phenylobacterium sp. TaxID=1871053 RepID=UPI00286BC7F1|nr:hypothetical protein [Phenylobacterium sp.]